MELEEGGDEQITISLNLYQSLQRDARYLRALEAAGVDNWEGCSEASKYMEESDE